MHLVDDNETIEREVKHMKLKITDDFWAVGHKTKRVKTIYAPLVIGPIEGLGDKGGYRIKKEGDDYIVQESTSCSYWNIDEVGDGYVIISYIRHDGVIVKTWNVTKKKGEYWRPRSMDGGHEYTMKLVTLF